MCRSILPNVELSNPPSGRTSSVCEEVGCLQIQEERWEHAPLVLLHLLEDMNPG